MEQYLEAFKQCKQWEAPFCRAACPFSLDVLDFMEKIKRGAFQAAFRTYRNAVGFPAIVNQLCPAPCMGVCPVKEPLNLQLLERASMDYAKDTSPTEYNLPPKKGRIAIIGAGLSGMGALLRLATKKYEVEIFEARDKIGGSLWETMDSEIFLKDFETQLAHQDYRLHLNSFIENEGELAGFDAVYVATGKGGRDFGVLSALESNPILDSGQGPCKYIGQGGWFAGGGLLGQSAIEALAEGLYMGTVIDNFLKTEILAFPPRENATRLLPTDLIIPEFRKSIVPTAGSGPEISASARGTGFSYTKDEALAESARCLECRCDSCLRGCDLTVFFNKWPLKIKDEILATTLAGSSEIKATPAKRLLSTCSQCGLCKEVCPESIDLGGLILAGRQSVHRQGKVPWAFHDFWLRDMAQANSVGIIKPPTGKETCAYAFFPGCQLGASEPILVEKTYETLLSIEPDTGLFTNCCGVPAEWAGDLPLHGKELEKIRSAWLRLGKPILILACMTCMKQFEKHLPEIPTISLYEFWSDRGFYKDLKIFLNTENQREFEEGLKGKSEYGLFDPCAARHMDKVKAAVRKLLPEETETVNPEGKCCSFGGQGAIANPPYAKMVTEKRISLSERPYITYCINCRDSFLAAGKESVHILDLIFHNPPKLATVTERQFGRRLLRKNLLKTHWGEEVILESNKFGLKVLISPELAAKISKEQILEENVEAAIDFCRRHSRWTSQVGSNVRSGYHQIGYMTYWVQWTDTEDPGVVNLENAYTHRMEIELEAVWNGIKQETDLR